MGGNQEPEIEKAFSILLGRPLTSAEATVDPKNRYELWFWVSSEMFDDLGDLGDVDLARPIAADASSAEHDRGGYFWERYKTDYAHSLFVFDEDELSDIPRILHDPLRTAGFALTGKELVDLTQSSDIDSDSDIADLLGAVWYVCRRAVTDGSLKDAMAAATLSSSAPKRLLSRASEGLDMPDQIVIDPHWAEQLSAIADPILREHFEMSCVDAQTGRWTGAYLPKAPRLNGLLKPVAQRGGELVIGWEIGEGQAARAIFCVHG